MIVGMASVAIHEELFPGLYQEAIAEWLRLVEARTDSLGLISHASYWPGGEVMKPARGSSQSLILNFLIEIDSSYARDKFEIYKEVFLDYRMGMPGIREYPKGAEGNGDIDSGPVIFDIGGAASIVGQRVMARYGEDEIAMGLRNSIEAFGVGKTKGGKKNYLFGQLAMADAFIAWSNAVEATESEKLTGTGGWRLKVQFLSAVLLLIGGWVII